MAEATKPRIVVAEDDEAVLELVRTRLEIAGYAVSYARTGHAAIETIRAVQPTAVVLDLNMPGLDGFGVLTALRSQKSRTSPPTLVLTARHAAEDVKRCLALGAKDYLAKPFKDKDLLARVARLVRLSTQAVRPTEVEMFDPKASRPWFEIG